MYLKGFAQDVTDYSGGTTMYFGPPTPDVVATTYSYVAPPTPVAVTPPPGPGTNWGALVASILQPAQQAYNATQQADVQQAQIQRYGSYYPMSPLPLASPGYVPGYSPFPAAGSGGTLFGMSMTTLLILGAIGFAAFKLMK